MPYEISREEILEMIEHDEDFELVEVLSRGDYAEGHLPTAMSIPLGPNFEDRLRARLPDQNTEVIFYCRDEKCAASGKAAERAERLGYGNVYHYGGGKSDWVKAGLPLESGGRLGQRPPEAA